MLRDFGDMTVCPTRYCKSCELGDKDRALGDGKGIHDFTISEMLSREHQERTCGFGYTVAPVFLVGETPRDMSEGEGGRASGAFGVNESEFEEEIGDNDSPILSSVKSLGIPSSSFYSTTAIKCPVPKGQTPTKGSMTTCMGNHLGAELEKIEPLVVWLTGSIGSFMLAEHFSGADIPEIGIGEQVDISSPDIWRFDSLYIFRSPHPSQVLNGVEEYYDIESVAAKTLLVLSRFL